ncbi:MAG: hypothetical protein HY903_06790 [Deltaproteobacteria bacterium]|nr:hypothetical protein [Deltaproteobacteria bacterium]
MEHSRRAGLALAMLVAGCAGGGGVRSAACDAGSVFVDGRGCVLVCRDEDDCAPDELCIDRACTPVAGVCSADVECATPGVCEIEVGAWCEGAACHYLPLSCVQPQPVNPCAELAGTCDANRPGCQGLSCCEYAPAWPAASGDPAPPCPFAGEDDGDGVQQPAETWSGHCDHTGTCADCTDASQCNDGNVCTLDSCTAGGVCSYAPAWPTTSGAPSPPCPFTDEDDGDGVQQPAETWSGHCDHVGTCAECADASQCNDGNECTLDSCVVGGVCSNDTEAYLGRSCTVAQPDDGECTAQGPNAIGCEFIRGHYCDTGDECATGECADHRCCNDACVGNCNRCDVAGNAGTCVLVDTECGGNCDVCAASGNCEAVAARCTGNCDTCVGADKAFSCQAVESACDGTRCTTCTASAANPTTEFNCVFDAARDAECPDAGTECYAAGECRKSRLEYCTSGPECMDGLCLANTCLWNGAIARPQCNAYSTAHPVNSVCIGYFEVTAGVISLAVQCLCNNVDLCYKAAVTSTGSISNYCGPANCTTNSATRPIVGYAYIGSRVPTLTNYDGVPNVTYCTATQAWHAP